MEEGLENAPRRKRVSRACDRCRSKKDKCDGIRPTCSACQASGLACCYDPHAKKRGLPEGYVRGLEKLWALSICNIEGFEETMMAMLGSTAESAERREKVMAVWADENSSESLHETWKSSRLLGALEKMLSNPETSSFAAGKRARNPQDKYLDCATGNWGFRVGKQTSPLGPDAPRIVTGLAEPSGVKRPRMAQTAESRGSMQTSDGFHALQLPPQSSQLLDLYFAATHSWFPIIAKHNILRASYLYANSPFSVSTHSPGSGDHAALWGILSYTVAQSRLDSRADMSDSISLAKDYYTVARNLIPSEKDRYELGHVQALLLLALVNTGLDDWTAAWLLSGQAVRMALAMELGTNSNAGRSDDWRQGKAVFLGCFVIDSLLSFRLGHCPALSAHDIAATGLLEEDGLEEWNSWADVLLPAGDSRGPNFPRRGPLRALSCFNRLVELATALNKIARNLSMGYTASTFAQQLVMDLKQWDDFLPLGCRLIGPESIYPERHSALLPHQSYLGLLYVATLLWLYLHLVPDEQNIDRLQRPATEGAQQLLCRASLMLSLHVENFPMCRLPPILEFGLRTIPEQALSLRQSIDPPNAFPFSRWADDFRQKIIALAPTWPVYDGLIASMEQWQANDDCTRPSHVLFSKKPGSSRPTGHEFLPPSTNAHGMSPTNGDGYVSSILGTSISMIAQSMTPKDPARTNTDLSAEAPSGLLEKRPFRSGSDAVHQSGSVHAQTPDSSTSMMTGKAPTSERSATTGVGLVAPDSEELDAIFQDLAYLDTTEWSTNREAGLKDFGFLDDSTFQAFCHDPDRLGGTQPFVHPPSIADIWPPPGFFPETFQEAPEKSLDG